MICINCQQVVLRHLLSYILCIMWRWLFGRIDDGRRRGGKDSGFDDIQHDVV